jgi:hypothetical protein
MSLLPVFYHDTTENVTISSSFSLLAKELRNIEMNADFVSDMILFNVPLGKTCFYKEIQRMPYGCQIEVKSGSILLSNLHRAWQEFQIIPTRYKEAVDCIADLFVTNGRYYYNEPTHIALTGGFDGRTNVSVSHYYDNECTCYTHGKSTSSDVQIPLMITNKLGIEHKFIDLSSEFINEHHLKSVQAYLLYSGGMNGFIYPYIAYEASVLARDNKPVITGYCGSELLRNAHFGGAIVAQTVIDLIDKNEEYAFNQFGQNIDKNRLNREYIKMPLCEERIHEISKYLSDYPEYLSKNQMLAVFELEEIMPKIFGTFAYVAMHYHRTRLPYMDYEFFRNIVKTEVSQVYRNFMEQRPSKRFWGQYLYAKIIDKTWPELGRLQSNKGYTPYDLLTIQGKIGIIRGYLRKRRRISLADYDSLGIVSGLQLHFTTSSKAKSIKDLYGDIDGLNKMEHRRDIISFYASALEYDRMITTRELSNDTATH